LQTAHYLPEKRVIRNYIADISEQKLIETELQQAESIYSGIFQQVSEAIIIVESATKQIIKANSACSELLGYSHDELLQMNIYELVAESDKLAQVLHKHQLKYLKEIYSISNYLQRSPMLKEVKNF